MALKGLMGGAAGAAMFAAYDTLTPVRDIVSGMVDTMRRSGPSAGGNLEALRLQRSVDNQQQGIKALHSDRQPAAVHGGNTKSGVSLQLAVAGAHLSGLALNYQLLDLDATLVRTVRTAPVYKLYSLGPKPALIRQPPGQPGGSIELEVWELPIENVGAFLRDGVKAPLGIGDVLLDDESAVKGFIGEGYAAHGAPDITHYGGWRAYTAAQQQQKQQ